jgi:hypothetical protein
VLLEKTLSTRAKTTRQYPFQANDFSAMFNRNRSTPEIIKQAAERKKIQPRRGVLRIVSELSATLTLPDYGMIARDPGVSAID